MRDASGLEWYNVGIKICDVEERLRLIDRRAERRAHTNTVWRSHNISVPLFSS